MCKYLEMEMIECMFLIIQNSKDCVVMMERNTISKEANILL